MSARTAGTVLAFVAVGCGASDKNVGPSDMDRRAMLEHVATHIVVPSYESFQRTADELVSAVDVYCETLDGVGDPVIGIEAARLGWREAMDSWQLAEMMVFGPASMDEDGLRDRIYSWDIVSTCAVDQAVALHLESPLDLTTQDVNRKGLDAAEYLIYSEQLDHTCPSQLAPEGWNDLDEETRRKARCAYAAAVAGDVSAAAGELVSAWSPEGGDYLAEIARAGTGDSSFGSAREALDVVTEAVFYVDGSIKDMKIGEPAGIGENVCGTVQEPCPEELESPFAAHSLSNIERNFVAFSALYTGDGIDGTSGPGYRQLLLSVGADDLASAMDADIDAVTVALAAIEPPLRSALTNNYQGVVSLHQATTRLTDDLKSQFLTVLGIALPGGESDND